MEEERELLTERLELSMDRIRGFLGEESVQEPYRDYFYRVADFIMQIEETVKKRQDGALFSMDGEAAAAWNRRLYEDILPENYGTSYANPAYAVKRLGDSLGKLLSFLYAEIRGDIVYVYEGRILEIVIYNEALIEIYNLFEGEVPAEKSVRDVLYWCVSDYSDVTVTGRIRENLDPSLDFAKRIILESNLCDPAYLYRFGEYISEGELRLASFLSGLSEADIARMADTFTDGFCRGFEVMGRDLSKKSAVAIRYPLGFERVIRRAVKNFEGRGLSVIIPRAAVEVINRNPAGKVGYSSSSPNRQYEYDHRFDSALYLDKAFRDRKLAVMKTAYEQYKKEAGRYAGPAVMEFFGEEGFSPVNKPEAYSFDGRQQKLDLEYRNQSMQITNEYLPGDETSFTIIAFPVPAIGKDFEAIFRETIEINTLDYEKYKTLQQTLIETLDGAVTVRILGRGTNRTDMTVALWELKDKKTQTNFENCVADVNIPVGEVFTSPKLSGTHGILNVESVYIGDIRFENLRMEFEDGRVKTASCDNFLRKLGPDAAEGEREAARIEGAKLVRQQVMNGHENLPLGEFAIGTNTTAYAMAERYGILDKLPILIVEKMGPHFAVGDTCYSWSEDSPMMNPDGREMIARDNEISILRKTDVSKAYFGVHTDITVPYREIGRISAVRKDGTEISLIENGRFVLAGVEELNEPLEKL